MQSMPEKNKQPQTALVTGSRGFVGKYLRKELEAHGYTVIGLDIHSDEKTRQGNILDAEEMKQLMGALCPQVVFHLAGQANVAASWSIPQKTMELNVIGTLNLMEALREKSPATRMLLVGSSDQYGALGNHGALVQETLSTNPQTPYAVSKKAQEEMAQIYAGVYGLNLCMTRSFNHCGAGQREGFLIPDFAAGIVRVERGLQPSLKVGNLTARRDFTHVKDVVRAYRLLAERGVSGEIYNVGAGKTFSAQEILDGLMARATCAVPIQQDPKKMRPSDTPVICCDHSKLTRDTGWEAEIPMEAVLDEVLQEWRTK